MKIKTLLIVGMLFSVANIFAQIPTGYYDETAGLSGAALKTKLSQIITNGHRDMGYGSGTGGLWTAYFTTDVDNYYEKDGTVLDMYSENPAQNTSGISNDAYQYKLGQASAGGNQCGNGKNYENSCYNREHSLPKSYFGGINATPMANDAHFVIPTDYYVNNQRGNYLYGETNSTSQVFTNGSKIGNSSFPGYSGNVFEPINEFKGDLARMWLYFITRYESQLPNFYNLNVSGSPFDGSTHNGFQQWIINLLLKWHQNDPVSQREIDRNNAVYTFQGNRNPFIDHPEFVTLIWKSTLATSDIEKFSLNLYPNPVQNKEVFFKGNIQGVENVKVYDMNGKLVYEAVKPFAKTNKLTLKNLPKGNYIITYDNKSQKLIIE
ncbi:endonuclease [Cloacibacterium normanense]|uniref:endonuclease n=1 Tax=Cloacibacterium normanense TaxID=237258 RepID=UPI0035B28C8F